MLLYFFPLGLRIKAVVGKGCEALDRERKQRRPKTQQQNTAPSKNHNEGMNKEFPRVEWQQNVVEIGYISGC